MFHVKHIHVHTTPPSCDASARRGEPPHSLFNTLTSNNFPTSPPPLYRLRHAMPPPTEASPLTLPLSPHTHSPQLIIHITPPLYHLHHAMPPPTEASPPHSPTLTSHPLPQLIIHIAPPLYRLHHAMPPPTEASPLAAKHPILHSCIFSVRV